MFTAIVVKFATFCRFLLRSMQHFVSCCRIRREVVLTAGTAFPPGDGERAERLTGALCEAPAFAPPRSASCPSGRESSRFVGFGGWPVVLCVI